MSLVIATATTREMAAVLAGLSKSGCAGRALTAPEGNDPTPVTVTAGDGIRPCLLLVTGVGPINAALSLGRVLGMHREVRGVLNLGVAGTFDALRAPLGGVVLASAEVWPEYGLAGDHGVDPRGIAFPQAKGPAGPVWNRIDIAAEALLDQWRLSLPATACRGVALTVAGVSGTPARAAAMRRRHAPLMENMEGFSLALACLRHGLPFAEARTVSNIVGSRAAEDWALKEALEALETLARQLFLTD